MQIKIKSSVDTVKYINTYSHVCTYIHTFKNKYSLALTDAYVCAYTYIHMCMF